MLLPLPLYHWSDHYFAAELVAAELLSVVGLPLVAGAGFVPVDSK